MIDVRDTKWEIVTGDVLRVRESIRKASRYLLYLDTELWVGGTRAVFSEQFIWANCRLPVKEGERVVLVGSRVDGTFIVENLALPDLNKAFAARKRPSGVRWPLLWLIVAAVLIAHSPVPALSIIPFALAITGIFECRGWLERDRLLKNTVAASV